MVEYAGFSMPVQYMDLSIQDSVKHTRSHASIFDVSHMLQTEIVGSDCEYFLESLTTADILNLPVNNGTLSVFTNQNGGVLDDLILSKTDQNKLFVVTNASCIEKDLALLQNTASKWRNNGKNVKVNILDRALIALQGPKAISILRDDANVNLDQLYFMQTTVGRLFDIDNCRITRCGYTGEDGFEISVEKKNAKKLVNYFLQSKKGSAKLAGLGARDVLRLEAGLCLYGNDINENTTPVEAGISFVVAKRRRETLDFPGAKKIIEQLESKNLAKKRVGFVSCSGRSPRSHLPIIDSINQASVGFITSGCPSPCLDKNISMGYVDGIDAKPGRELQVDFGRKTQKITVTKMPFVPTKYYTKKK